MLRCLSHAGAATGRRRSSSPPATAAVGWVGRTHCWVRPPEEPDLRLSPHPARAGPSGLITQGPTIRSTGSGSSAGPLTAAMTAASSLSIGSGVVVIVVFGVHLTTSALFRAGSRGSVSGRLSETIARRARPSCPGFPLRFRCRRSLLGHPLPAEELGVPRGRLTGQGRTQTGFPRSARTSCDRGGCPLYSGDGGAHPDRSRSPASACRITATCPYAPPQPSIDAGLCFTKHQPRVQVLHPSDLPLAWTLPDGTGASWA